MADEVKVTETPKVSDGEPIIDNFRSAVENAVIHANETPNIVVDEVEVREPVEEKVEEPDQLSEVDRIKQAVQKRINQVVAKQKSAEEQLADAQAEIARLKASNNTSVADKKGDEVPTIEQVEAYIIRMREEGNVKEEIAATRYLIKLEKEAAIKEVEGKQNAVQNEAKERANKESAALLDLAKDYIVYDKDGKPDMKSELTLSNQKGKLFQIAMGLYNDNELRKLYYNDPDRVNGFRRAVSDAYREIHQQGLINTPKVDGLETVVRSARAALAEPDAQEAEPDSTQSPSNHLSDAEKVRDEIKQRNKLRNSRTPSR